MTEKIIIAGAGGQGVMLLGKVLIASAMKEGKHVTWLPAYGAEVRGGTAYCMVIISDEEIGSPYIDKADTLIVMNRPSLYKFQPRLKADGLLVVNRSLIGEWPESKTEVLNFPFSDIAVDIGNIKIANMVVLGCFAAKKNIVDIENILNAIEEIAPPDKKGLVDINKHAVMAGRDLINLQERANDKSKVRA